MTDHPLIQSLATLVAAAPKPKPWHAATLTEQVLTVLQRECETPSEFDQIFSRKHFWALYQAGQIDPVVRTTVGGTLVALLHDKEQLNEIPWTLWSTILQLYKRPDGKSYTIYFCAHPALRTFPTKKHHPVTPLNINGGYTYPCDSTCVFIYRAEDATRVLIHELFHAACSDTPNKSLDETEAETEAWAELVWCGFMGGGDLKKTAKAIEDQASWIHHQNRRLQEDGHMKHTGQVVGAPSPNPFPWRYTVGKEHVWARWGLATPADTANDKCDDHAHSLRLTFHPTAAMKRMWKVTEKSTIL